MKRKDETTWDKVFWSLLNKSRIFRYLFRRFLTTLMFELERFDFDPEPIREKYAAKLNEYGG